MCTVWPNAPDVPEPFEPPTTGDGAPKTSRAGFCHGSSGYRSQPSGEYRSWPDPIPFATETYTKAARISESIGLGAWRKAVSMNSLYMF